MKRNRRKNLAKAGLAAAAFIASATIALPTFATPGSGFTPSPQPVGVLPPAHFNADKADKWDLFLKSKNSSTVGVDIIAVSAGGQSGWHTHTGMTLVTVTSGELQWYDGEDPICAFKTYRAGDSFIEPNNHVHLVRNPTASPASFVAVQVRPEGTGPRIDEPTKPTNCPAF